MKARLVQSTDGKLQLLCANGSISPVEKSDLANFLVNFERAGKQGSGNTMWTETCLDMSMYPGETVGFVTDDNKLVLHTFAPFVSLLGVNDQVHNFLTAAEYAKKYGKSVEVVKLFCREGRILGAVKKGNAWVIPEDAPYPVRRELQKDRHRGSRT